MESLIAFGAVYATSVTVSALVTYIVLKFWKKTNYAYKFELNDVVLLLAPLLLSWVFEQMRWGVLHTSLGSIIHVMFLLGVFVGVSIVLKRAYTHKKILVYHLSTMVLFLTIVLNIFYPSLAN